MAGRCTDTGWWTPDQDAADDPGFLRVHQLPDVTIVADAGMVSAANQKAIEAAGLSFILGLRIPESPTSSAWWRKAHPDREIPDGQVFTQPCRAERSGADQVIYYQYRADRARRTLRGIDDQVAKAEKAVAGKTTVKRNRFVQLSGGPGRSRVDQHQVRCWDSWHRFTALALAALAVLAICARRVAATQDSPSRRRDPWATP